MPSREQASLRCSFCNKPRLDVKALIAGPAVLICDECVDICNDILAKDKELEPDGSIGSGAFGTGKNDALVRCRLCQTLYQRGGCNAFPDRGWLCHGCLSVVRTYLESAGRPVA